MLFFENQIIHALGQTLVQRDGDANATKYFYLHDRLGSVRELVYLDSATVKVKNRYTYDPFGGPFTAETEGPDNFNPYRFAGYNWDGTIKQYYCNARWYDPALFRFTGRDPVFGNFNEPLTLHAYLYCLNDPINRVDPSGEFFGLLSAQGVMGWMRNTSAAVAVGVKGVAVGLVSTVNAINTMTSSLLISAANYGYFAVAEAMYFGRNLLTQIAATGLREMQIFGGVMKDLAVAGYSSAQQTGFAISNWAMTHPEEAGDVSKVLLGDPHPPSTVEGGVTYGSIEGGKWLKGELEKYFEQGDTK